MEVLRTELEAVRIEADCCGTKMHKESAEIHKGFFVGVMGCWSVGVVFGY
jgi:hypothetical protein